MKPLPLPLRLAAGLVATAIEEVQQLPRKLVELPVTAVSQVLQASMRMQQRATELAIKGDQALGVLRPVPETPTWARFDEDELEYPFDTANGFAGVPPATDWDAPERYQPHLPARTVSPILITREPAPEPTPTSPRGLEDYESWSLPQLRGHLRSLSLIQVQALLAWETSHRDRPPYVTMLSNRTASISGR
ncbi:MAG: lipid droplet-associated protein [Actinomycetota bacterium]|nr:lipid droplet-associated protein [Actinomycetota bacterium]